MWTGDSETTAAHVNEQSTPTFFGFPLQHRPKSIGRGYLGYDDVHPLQMSGLKLTEDNVPPPPLKRQLAFKETSPLWRPTVIKRLSIPEFTPRVRFEKQVDNDVIKPENHIFYQVAMKGGNRGRGNRDGSGRGGREGGGVIRGYLS